MRTTFHSNHPHRAPDHAARVAVHTALDARVILAPWLRRQAEPTPPTDELPDDAPGYPQEGVDFRGAV